jgi:HK97 family phage portal protein
MKRNRKHPATRAQETRAQVVGSSDPYVAEFLGYGGGRASLDADRAGGLATALACVSVVSQALASVPLRLHLRTAAGGRDVARDHPLYAVLYDQFVDGWTAYEGREFLVACLMMHDNAYAEIEWNPRGQVTALRPIHPSRVRAELTRAGVRRYHVTGRDGGQRVLLSEDILHLRNRIGRDGVTGVSPVEEARETFLTGVSQQDTAQRQAAKGFRPEGALIFPAPIGSAARTQSLEAIRAKIMDDSGTGAVHVLDSGIEWKPISFSSKDAEFLASRAATDEAICRVFGVPPTSVGILTHGTYSNVEQESRALVVRCLAPMARRIETAMTAGLLPLGSRASLFVEHDLGGLMRGDLTARYAAYQVGRNGGWLSANEIRAFENMPEIEGGGVYLQPLNMVEQGAQGSAGGGA